MSGKNILDIKVNNGQNLGLFQLLNYSSLKTR